jgi:hypothetical protein
MTSFMFLIVIGMIAALIIYVQKDTARAKAASSEALTAQRARLTELKAENLRKVSEQLPGFQSVDVMFLDDKRYVGAISGDRTVLKAFRVLEYKDVDIGDFLEVQTKSILLAELNSPSVQKYVREVKTEAVVIQTKKSSIGRALVGGVLLGPVGAVVGAASGVGGKQEIKHVQTPISREVTSKGPLEVVLRLNDMQKPMLRLRGETNAKTEEWFHRINLIL